MSRLTNFSSRWLSGLTAKGQLYIGLLGNKVILATAEKVLFDQSASFLFHQTDQKLIACGDQALSWQSNLAVHNSVKLIKVLEQGALSDLESAEVFFRYLFSNCLEKDHYQHFKLSFFYQSFLSPIQKQHLSELFKKLGFSKISATPIGKLVNNQSEWILFLGEDVAELSLVKQANLLVSYKLNFQVSAINLNLQHFFQDNLGLKLTQQELARILTKLDLEADKNLLLQIKGEDAQHQFTVKSIKAGLVIEQLVQSFDTLLEQLKLYLNLAEMSGLSSTTMAQTNTAQQSCLLFGPVLKNWPFIGQFLAQKTTLAIKTAKYPDFLLAHLSHYV